MQKLIITFFVLLLFPLTGSADTKLLDEVQLKGKDGATKFAVRTVCIDGYKFVITRDLQYLVGNHKEDVTAALSTVQFYENDNGKAVPAKC